MAEIPQDEAGELEPIDEERKRSDKERGFWAGDYIAEADIDEITSAEPATMVFLMGLRGSGKTTLIASIYEHFQRGAYGGYQFAGSKTLLGLERLCFLARAESEGEKQDTERTNITPDVRFVHIRVRDQGHRSPARSVMFSDVYGELFREAADSAEDCSKLAISRRADSFVFLVDGAKLLDRVERHVTVDTVLMLLQRLIDIKYIHDNSRVDFLFTKKDVIRDSLMAKEVVDFVEDRKAYISDRFGKQVARLELRDIAARPETGGYAKAFGIEDLLSHWIVPSQRPSEEWVLHESHSRGAFSEHLPWAMV